MTQIRIHLLLTSKQQLPTCSRSPELQIIRHLILVYICQPAEPMRETEVQERWGVSSKSCRSLTSTQLVVGLLAYAMTAMRSAVLHCGVSCQTHLTWMSPFLQTSVAGRRQTMSWSLLYVATTQPSGVARQVSLTCIRIFRNCG